MRRAGSAAQASPTVIFRRPHAARYNAGLPRRRCPQLSSAKNNSQLDAGVRVNLEKSAMDEHQKAITPDPVTPGESGFSLTDEVFNGAEHLGRRHRSLVQGLGEVDVECRECSDSDERKLCCECKKNVQ